MPMSPTSLKIPTDLLKDLKDLARAKSQRRGRRVSLSSLLRSGARRLVRAAKKKTQALEEKAVQAYSGGHAPFPARFP